PLSKNIRSIAVIGVDADEARLGGYSGPGNNKINILEGLKQKTGAKVLYAPGCSRNDNEYAVIPAAYLSHGVKTGLEAEYFNNTRLDGATVIHRIDPTIDFHWTLYPPDPAITKDHYSARWTGQLFSPETGKFKIGLEGNDGYRLYINDKIVIDNWKKESYRRIVV